MSVTKYEQWDREWCDPLRREVAKLEAERDALRAQLATAHRERDGWRDDAESRKAEIEKHRQLARDPWHWMGNGEDHLETLVCPVLIMPSDLRRLLAVPEDAELDAITNALHPADELGRPPDGCECRECNAADAITVLRRRLAELEAEPRDTINLLSDACECGHQRSYHRGWHNTSSRLGCIGGDCGCEQFAAVQRTALDAARKGAADAE